MSKQKELMATEIKEMIFEKDVLITGFEKMDSALTTQLRQDLREIGAKYFVVKNRILARVLSDVGYEYPEKWTGHTALATSDDVVSLTKKLKKISEDCEGFNFRFGYLQSKLLNENEIDVISKCPPREVLLGKLVGILNAPIANFAGVLRAQLSKIVYVLSSIADSKKR